MLAQRQIGEKEKKIMARNIKKTYTQETHLVKVYDTLTDKVIRGVVNRFEFETLEQAIARILSRSETEVKILKTELYTVSEIEYMITPEQMCAFGTSYLKSETIENQDLKEDYLKLALAEFEDV